MVLAVAFGNFTSWVKSILHFYWLPRQVDFKAQNTQLCDIIALTNAPVLHEKEQMAAEWWIVLQELLKKFLFSMCERETITVQCDSRWTNCSPTVRKLLKTTVPTCLRNSGFDNTFCVEYLFNNQRSCGLMRLTNWLTSRQAVQEKKNMMISKMLMKKCVKNCFRRNLRYSPPPIYFCPAYTLFSGCESN